MRVPHAKESRIFNGGEIGADSFVFSGSGAGLSFGRLLTLSSGAPGTTRTCDPLICETEFRYCSPSSRARRRALSRPAPHGRDAPGGCQHSTVGSWPRPGPHTGKYDLSLCQCESGNSETCRGGAGRIQRRTGGGTACNGVGELNTARFWLL